MNREQFIDHLQGTYFEALAIVHVKNKDYGADSNPFKNFTLVSHLGIPVQIGILTRFADKVARISNLIQNDNPAVVSESLDDTILDAINYLAILRAWREKERLEQVQPEKAACP